MHHTYHYQVKIHRKHGCNTVSPRRYTYMPDERNASYFRTLSIAAVARTNATRKTVQVTIPYLTTDRQFKTRTGVTSQRVLCVRGPRKINPRLKSLLAGFRATISISPSSSGKTAESERSRGFFARTQFCMLALAPVRVGSSFRGSGSGEWQYLAADPQLASNSFTTIAL
ncbi:hypothetical protein BDW75DRAFT_200111 [Aspergillus navahoensis]